MKKLLVLFAMIWLPLAAWSADGDTFTANTVEGVAMTFKVTSEANKQCQVGVGSSRAISQSITGAITIPSEVNGYSVSSIGRNAFNNCSGLTSVTIGNSVTSIGQSAFAACSGLTSITIPNSVTSIEESAFAACSGLSSIVVESGNTVYDSRDNCNAIIITETDELIAGFKNTIIPNSVTRIGNWAFVDCSSMTSITIPNSVTSIGEGAFTRCRGLTSITIPNSVTSIGYDAFNGCSGLTSISIPNSVTSIGDYAFQNCRGLTSVTIPNSVTSIGEYAFSSCSGLTSVTIPNSVMSIGVRAFDCCSRLTSVHISDITSWCNINFGDIDANPLSYARHLYLNGGEIKDLVIPNSVTNIGDYAFQGCRDLTSVAIPNSVTSIGASAFRECRGLTSVTIPNSVMSIGQSAFEGCIGLTSVTIPNSVTSIGGYAFSRCSGLTSVTIPNSVTSIGDGAFYECRGLTSVTIPNSVTSIGGYAFSRCSGLTSVTIPNSVKSIGEYAFQGCSGLISVTIPTSVTSIGGGAFNGCSGLTSIVVESGNSVYDSRDNCNSIINTETNELIKGCKSTVIPKSVTSIREQAFLGCSGLISVTIPNSVTSIGPQAFYNCTGLTEVYSLIEEPFAIYNGVFSGLSAKATLYVPKGTKAKYEATDGWKEFKNIIEIVPEVLLAEDVSIRAGKTATADICLNNETTKDFTAYQFDLVLPAGIDIAKNAKGKPDVMKGTRYEDDNQSLTVQKVDGTTDTYRVMSFSLENGLITGTEGALLTVRLQADAELAEGEYIARMENIVMTRKDGTQIELSDATLKITVNRITMGDTNGDEIVNVTDIVEVVNCIMGHPSAGFVRAAADLNGDNIVNVTDIVMIVNIIMSDGKARCMEPTTVTDANDRLTLDGKGGDSFGLSLHNDARYVAAQMDIVLTEGQTLENVSLSKNRCGSHLLNCQQTGRNTYCVMLFSMTNEGFEGFDGSLLSFGVTGGTGGFSVENIVFVKADKTQRTFDALYGQTTGIGATLNDKGQMINDNWYDLNGRKLDGQPNRKGLYVKDGKKQVK